MPSRTLAPLPSRLILVVVGLAWACGAVAAAPAEPAAAAQAVPTAAGARQFLADADRTLRTLFVDASVAEWTNETDITPAHEAAAAAAADVMARGISELVKAAHRFEPLLDTLDADSRRQFLLLRLAAQPAPDDPAQSAELARLASEMTSLYGKGKVCDATGRHCKDLDALSRVLQTSRDPAVLRATWQGWHDTVGRAEGPLFEKYVALANLGARDVGFRDVASLWRAGYDMPEEAFEAEVDRLWGQVRPLYDQLHCFERRVLNKRFGDAVQPRTGPIRADLTGDMWAQDWSWTYPAAVPYRHAATIDATPVLAARFDAKKMVRLGESFYTSIGMDPLPASFWQRSMFAKAKGKEAVCHASAWDVVYDDDLRIKMCIDRNQEDLKTIHHELGHDYYYHSYHTLPILYQQGANDGFHEAVGDTIMLSMTPEYLHARGLLGKVDAGDEATINRQLQVALDKIAFLPFGLLVDKWRWDAFSGRVKPADYNRHWWALRLKYQGVVPPVPRDAPGLFDPGAKYHVASNTPYMRYFLAAVLQFQFQRALCAKAGATGPLHACSIYRNKEAGAALQKMLALGASRPWQDALFELTGQREMDASAMLEYFAPLRAWLVQQNRGEQCGW